MQTKHPFNLVEILLALGVLMIGVIALLGVFPVAAKISGDAAMANHTASAVELFSAYIRELASDDANWDNMFKNSGNAIYIPDAEPSGMLYPDDDHKDLDSHIAIIQDSDNWTNAMSATNDVWSQLKDHTMSFSRYNTAKGVYLLKFYRNDLGAVADAESNPDASILITVWKSPIQRPVKGAAFSKYSYDYGARINMKIAWPAEMPEARHIDDDTDIPMREIQISAFDIVRTKDNAGLAGSTIN